MSLTLAANDRTLAQLTHHYILLRYDHKHE